MSANQLQNNWTASKCLSLILAPIRVLLTPQNKIRHLNVFTIVCQSKWTRSSGTVPLWKRARKVTGNDFKFELYTPLSLSPFLSKDARRFTREERSQLSPSVS